MGLLGLPWLGCCGAPKLLPALAYWYDGGRPSGCCAGFIDGASEVEEADGLRAWLWAGLALAFCGGAVEACDDVAEVMEEAVLALLPLVLAAAGFDDGGGERLVEEVFCEATEVWLELDLRVLSDLPATNRRNLLFMWTTACGTGEPTVSAVGSSTCEFGKREAGDALVFTAVLGNGSAAAGGSRQQRGERCDAVQGGGRAKKRVPVGLRYWTVWCCSSASKLGGGVMSDVLGGKPQRTMSTRSDPSTKVYTLHYCYMIWQVVSPASPNSSSARLSHGSPQSQTARGPNPVEVPIQPCTLSVRARI